MYMHIYICLITVVYKTNWRAGNPTVTVYLWRAQEPNSSSILEAGCLMWSSEYDRF